jgi:chemosensory pili system protein ChpA (sensor histidine kinase/response regulator)
MTTRSFIPPHGTSENFDIGPLSWVMGEIREALSRSKTTLHEALSQDAEMQSTALRHAKTYLHQAHGALQIVDVDGVAIITETVEDLLDRIEAGQLPLTSDIARAIENAYQALAEYLEELLSGAPHQPVRLFPYYRSLLEVRGAERIHPAELFFPNLAVRPQLPAMQPSAGATDYVTLRKRFERALLPFLKNANSATEQTHGSVMRDIIKEVEHAQSNQQSRAFWWVMQGFADAVASGQIRNELYIKQLFARINLQIRRLSEGSSSIAERLLRDALFFIARAENPSLQVRQIRHAYQLEGVIPADYEKKRYGQIDAEALIAAKERLSQAKSIWNRIAGGDSSVAQSFEQEMHGLADACTKLNSPPLAKLLRELNGIARHAHSNPGDGLGLEMATSLLFIENALNNISRLSDSFAARADAMTARLLSIVSGEQPAESAQWLDEMSRQAQQRQTMAALVTEMQSSLRQVEKMLDEYFRDPSQRAALGQIDAVLHQIEGALAILDQEDAMRAVQHTQEAVRRFANSEATPEQHEFQHVAQNVGALSFFIETLQLQSDSAQKRFSFDPERGVFQANLIEKNTAPEEVSDKDADRMDDTSPPSTEDFDPGGIDAASDVLPTVEAELAYHQQQSAELAASLSAEPHNPMLHEQLKETLEQVRLDATLVDNPEANDRAQAAIEILERPNFVASQDTLAKIISATAPLHTPKELIASPVTPDNDEAIDAELLEIFLSEAEEVLACVRDTVPQSRNEPYNQEHLTTLRRSFHTLKGSGRMVGLMAFGEAAWGIEQVLNLRLSETRAGDADLYALLDKADSVLGAWVEDLQTQGRSSRTAAALVKAAERVKLGGSFVFEEANAFPAPLDEAAQPAMPSAYDWQAQPGADAAPMSALLEDADLPLALPEEEEGILSDADLVSLRGSHPSADEAIVEAALANADATSAASVAPVADVIEFPNIVLPEVKRDDNVKHIGDLQISVPLHNIYLAETDELVRVLSQDIAEWRHEPDRHVNIHVVHAAHSLAGSSATVGFRPLQEIAYALEAVLQYLVRKPVKLGASDYDVFEHSIERIRFMLQMFALGEMPDREPHQVEILQRLLQELDMRAAVRAAPVIALNPIIAEIAQEEARTVVPPAIAPAPEPVAVAALTPSAHDTAFSEPVFIPQENAGADPALTPKDELDADLMPVFLEEGRDILPQIGQTLRAWQNKPDDGNLLQPLLRLLHTIKGSARMAGAMELGQHMHEMETSIERIVHSGSPSSQAIEDLLSRHDHGLQMFEQLLNPGTAKPAAAVPVPEQADNTQSARLEAASPALNELAVRALTPAAALTAAVASSSAPVPLVRVRADILDRLVNQAGEVSISRSKLETEVGTLRQSLSELNENVGRLRDQLREIEMQAESQITSRMAHSADREFDPLEFDRFTRLQELTRMMAESVNDVGSVQQNLTRTIDSASNDLTTQARLTRDLQQDLMRVRMVQFASISERLYRVTRQASKEVSKRVNLDIRGSAVEIDRGVLEKMAGPFEHLLRNAIVHGIEAREVRHANGKNEVGELLVEIRQEGNEVVIQFSDDGQGLNLASIRSKAKATGLLTDDSNLSDAEVTDLIFHPGFSTAEEITELRSEAAALGGRVAIRSEAGKGAHFTIHLPLTLAVTQVVLLATGGRTYAVPSVLVEQVQQLKSNSLASAYNDGAVVWQGQRVPMYYLSALLGDMGAAPVAQQYSPIVILRNGNDRVAIHVDEVQGNREVVVKNIGPQLARLIGIAGATVLGSGDIVLILNPVPLAQRIAHENVRAPRILPSDATHQMGAVAEMPTSEPAGPKSQPVQGLRTQHIVMVVDDSLTVRRVTQRLLAREGYRVVLAKDGVDALEHLQSITPDVMLVDIEMPRMDGFDLTRNVRSDERTRHIPLIMITSRTAAKHRNYAMELGVNEYLGKPYQEEALLQSIAGFIKNGTPIA